MERVHCIRSKGMQRTNHDVYSATCCAWSGGSTRRL